MAKKSQSNEEGGHSIEGFHGSLVMGDKSVDVSFDFHCDSRGNVTLSFQPIPWDDASDPIRHARRIKGRYAAPLALRGAAAEYSLRTDTAYLLSDGWRSTPDGATLTPQVKLGRVVVEKLSSGHESSQQAVQYCVTGMEGTPPQVSESPLGKVTFEGAWRSSDLSGVSGVITIESDTVKAAPEWLERCDEQVDAVLDVLSFAQGHRLRWSVRRHYVERALRACTYRGAQRTTEPNEPVFYKQNPKPAVELAIARYTAEFRKNTGMDLALEWYLMNPIYAEAQVMALMTAIEHLVFVYTRGNLLLNGSKFAKVKNEVKGVLAAIAKDDADVESVLDQMQQKLPELNRPTLLKNVQIFLEHYKVPMAGLRDGQLAELKSARDRITHRGYYERPDPEGTRLQDHIGFARELLRRVFLTLLGYEGEYRSWHDGPRTTHFPSMKPT